MGSPESDEEARLNEKPQHLVRITQPFYLGVYEVTQGEYERVMGENPSKFKGDPQRPVETVSWEKAVEFCRRLSEMEGKTYQLPTEAQWEYACRAGSTTKWCCGDSKSQLGDYAWYNRNSGSTTNPVGKKKSNAWGLYDMHGNVFEWCADWDDSDYYQDSPSTDPTGPSSGSDRVCRGGCLLGGTGQCRSALRYGYTPRSESFSQGFRVSLVLKQAKPKGAFLVGGERV